MNYYSETNEINLCIPTIRRLDMLTRCIKSAIGSRVQPTSINICDNGDICEGLPDFKTNIPINIFCPQVNYGVARSWNYFLHKYNDHIIISNDDVVFMSDTIGKLVGAAESRPDEVFFTCEGPADWNWSLYLQRKRTLAEIGSYDEFFYPAYWEDSDYKWRMKLKGYSPFVVPNCWYQHEGGATAESHLHINNGDKLDAYYKLKWGGDRKQEVYTTPFNLRSKACDG